MFNKLKATGHVTLTLRDAITGEVKQRQVRNLVPTAGERWISDRFLPSALQGPLTGQQDMKWIEIGTGGAAATAGGIALQHTYGQPTNVRRPYSTLQRSGATWTIICNWGTSYGNTAGIVEAGIFATASRVNTSPMLARTVFSAINKTNADTLKIQWDIHVADDGI